MPAATIASPKLFLAAIADPPPPRDGEEIPTLMRARSSGEEIPQTGGQK
jgi:hypothetical protein